MLYGTLMFKTNSCHKIQPAALWISEISYLNLCWDDCTLCLHHGFGHRFSSHLWQRTFLGGTAALQQNTGLCSWQWQSWSRGSSSLWDSNGMRSSLGSNKIFLDSFGNEVRSNSDVWLDNVLSPEPQNMSEINFIVKLLMLLIHVQKVALLHRTQKLLLCFRIAFFFFFPQHNAW